MIKAVFLDYTGTIIVEGAARAGITPVLLDRKGGRSSDGICVIHSLLEALPVIENQE